jgi:DNA-binding Lrp family transcriptional regulator
MDMSPEERTLINAYQRALPLTSRPYAAMGKTLGLSEDRVLGLLHGLSERGVLSRVGAVVAPNRAGASTLAAMEVPPERLEKVAAQVSAHPEVNHNYEREHNLNLWFVAAAADAGRLAALLDEIAEETGLEVVDLPLVEAYHIDLGFEI